MTLFIKRLKSKWDKDLRENNNSFIHFLALAYKGGETIIVRSPHFVQTFSLITRVFLGL